MSELLIAVAKLLNKSVIPRYPDFFSALSTETKTIIKIFPIFALLFCLFVYMYFFNATIMRFLTRKGYELIYNGG